jgi:hypothetical protein
MEHPAPRITRAPVAKSPVMYMTVDAGATGEVRVAAKSVDQAHGQKR